MASKPPPRATQIAAIKPAIKAAKPKRLAVVAHNAKSEIQMITHVTPEPRRVVLGKPKSSARVVGGREGGPQTVALGVTREQAIEAAKRAGILTPTGKLSTRYR